MKIKFVRRRKGIWWRTILSWSPWRIGCYRPSRSWEWKNCINDWGESIYCTCPKTIETIRDYAYKCRAAIWTLRTWESLLKYYTKDRKRWIKKKLKFWGQWMPLRGIYKRAWILFPFRSVFSNFHSQHLKSSSQYRLVILYFIYASWTFTSFHWKRIPDSTNNNRSSLHYTLTLMDCKCVGTSGTVIVSNLTIRREADLRKMLQRVEIKRTNRILNKKVLLFAFLRLLTINAN